MPRETVQGWFLLFSIVGFIDALNYPIFYPTHYLIAAAWFAAVHLSALLGMWPLPPADAERGGNFVSAGAGGGYIVAVTMGCTYLGRCGQAWLAFGVHFCAWLAWFCFLGSQDEKGV